MQKIICLFIVVFLLSSCKSNSPKIKEIGDMDQTNIANDTTMQSNLERSFEFQKELPLSTHSNLTIASYRFFENDKEIKKTAYILKDKNAQPDTLMVNREFTRFTDAYLSSDNENAVLFSSNPKKTEVLIQLFNLKNKATKEIIPLVFPYPNSFDFIAKKDSFLFANKQNTDSLYYFINYINHTIVKKHQ